MGDEYREGDPGPRTKKEDGQLDQNPFQDMKEV